MNLLIIEPQQCVCVCVTTIFCICCRSKEHTDNLCAADVLKLRYSALFLAPNTTRVLAHTKISSLGRCAKKIFGGSSRIFLHSGFKRLVLQAGQQQMKFAQCASCYNAVNEWSHWSNWKFLFNFLSQFHFIPPGFCRFSPPPSSAV